MSKSRDIKVALVGNPNTGKTSLFNQLTGLKQKVGNYPGITVDKKIGTASLKGGLKAHIIDLPGTYSINPTSIDENIVLNTLIDDLLPARDGGYRYANADPVTGQAAWYDLKVKVEKLVESAPMLRAKPQQRLPGEKKAPDVLAYTVKAER